MNFIKTFLAAILAFVVGSFLVFFLWIFILLGIAGSMEKTVAVHAESILKIDFSDVLTDAPSSDPFAGIDFATLRSTRQLPLMKALRALEAAKDDSRIKGIYLRMNGNGGVMGAALLEELREAVVDFKQSGKFVVAYDETYSQGKYYLASAADKIYMQPEGAMDWSGLAFNLMFYKGLLDKLDIKAEVFRPTACKYKSAVEPYILPKMSDANREQMQALVNSMWNTIAGSVAEARGIDLKELNRITDKLEVSLPEDALEHGFVDSLIYEDQMKDIFAELGVASDSDGEYNFITLGEYASQVGADLKNISADQVAVVYADGAIVDGEGFGKEIYGNTLAATLAGVRDDEKVKAVVLRVNSPGGSALASDVIWREMELLKAEKPVVVSMGSYAASGGYYISCPADAIMASPVTLTGSIGVFGLIFNGEQTLRNKLGITVDVAKTNPSADLGMTVFGAVGVRPLSSAERQFMQNGVERVYETFVGHVAEGRNMSVAAVDSIGGGRVWSGIDAVRIGLVDGFGGLREAIALAADRAGVAGDFRIVTPADELDPLSQVLRMMSAESRAELFKGEFGEIYSQYEMLQNILGAGGVQAIMPYDVRMR